jgi:hypothetical protein
MATGIESVLGMRENPRYKVRTSFPFEIRSLPGGEMLAKVTPPSEFGAKPHGPLFLTLTSDIKGSAIIPFQSPPKSDDAATALNVGGVVIVIGGEEKLVVNFERYFMPYILNQPLGDWKLRFRLMNADSEDQSVLVKPEDGEEPYILNNLQGKKSKRHDLVFFDNGWTQTNNGLQITHANGITLVEPHSL